MRGKFITFEGGEGSGKSTQVALLESYLKQKHIQTLITKEPGGTEEGRVLRNLLVTGDKDKFDPVTECLLYYADRRNHLTKVIWPALEKGIWVISDRYADSTEAYQYYGYGQRVEMATLRQLYQIVAGDFKPDLTLVLDIDPEVGMRRSFAKAETMAVKELRFESREMEFHQNLRKGFLEIAAREPQRCAVLNANQSIETLQQNIRTVIAERLGI